MSKHRGGGKRRVDVSRHRAEVRPRYGRMAVLGSSLAVVAIAVLGGTGALPSSSADARPDENETAAPADTGSGDDAATQAGEAAADPSPSAAGAAGVDDDPSTAPSAPETTDAGSADQVPVAPKSSADADASLPADSGNGRRVVFSESRQRVWLVTGAGEVERTYLVSGSVYDNLDPGTYEVYSRSEDAIGIDNSGTMKYFVRFTQGDEGAAIGFHDIPIDDRGPVQTVRQLGTPLSHGCIRQKRSDAIALWEFAPIGTTVVVTA